VNAWLATRRDAAIDSLVADVARYALGFCIVLLAILPPYTVVLAALLVVVLGEQLIKKNQNDLIPIRNWKAEPTGRCWAWARHASLTGSR
jgi:hypothetical protein